MGDLTVGDVAVDINGVVLCVCRRCYVFLRLLLHAYVGCAVLDRKILYTAFTAPITAALSTAVAAQKNCSPVKMFFFSFCLVISFFYFKSMCAHLVNSTYIVSILLNTPV